VKPLYIELSNRNLQLMCACGQDWLDTKSANGTHEDFLNAVAHAFPDGRVTRLKHEVSALAPGEHALYWEAHVKVDGVFRPDFGMASRDLYREKRWYVTRRLRQQFDGLAFAKLTEGRLKHKADQKYDSFEYEAVLIDTNPELDKGWEAL